jgi:hypothetical protein
MEFFQHLNDDLFALGFIGKTRINISIFFWLETEVNQLEEYIEQLYDDNLDNILTTATLESIKRQFLESGYLFACEEKITSNPNVCGRSEVIALIDWGIIIKLIEKQNTHKLKCLLTYLIGKELLEKSKQTKEISLNSVVDFESWLSLYNINISHFNAMKKNISNINSQSAKKRHEPSRKTKAYAIGLFQKMNEQKSVKGAVRTFYKDVIEYGKANNFIFTDEIQAFDTIYQWILKYKKDP